MFIQGRFRRAGFTLIELLVTLAIMALVMTALLATLQGTVRAHDEAAVEISSVRDGPRILDMVERDLRAIHVYNLKEGKVLSGKSERPGGLRGDRIDLVCSNDSIRRMADPTEGADAISDVASDLNEVGYRLRSSTLSDDFMELWRREDLFVDDEPFEGGIYEKIHDRVRRFEVTYLDHLGDKAEEKTDWDMAEEKRLPGAIRIDIELQASPELVGGFVEVAENALRVYHYMRVIAIPDDETVALSIQPYLPTKITGRNDKGGGKGSGEKDDAAVPGGLDPLGGGGNAGLPGAGDSMEMFTDNDGGAAPAGGGRERFKLGDAIGGGAQPGLDIHPGGEGELSEADQKKIEDFINDYRNHYQGSGGAGIGFGSRPPGS